MNIESLIPQAKLESDILRVLRQLFPIHLYRELPDMGVLATNLARGLHPLVIETIRQNAELHRFAEYLQQCGEKSTSSPPTRDDFEKLHQAIHEVKSLLLESRKRGDL